MAETKTKPTKVSVERHIGALTDAAQRDDALRLLALMKKVTKATPTMWGPTIIGFGSYHYVYASGHEGDAPLAGFAIRGKELVLYLSASFEGRDGLLAKLGKHRSGKACVYIKRLEGLDLKVLEQLIARSVEAMKRAYPNFK